MLKLVRADFYKTFHRSAYYLMLAAFSALAAALVFMMRGGSVGSFAGALALSRELLPYPAALLPLVTQLTLGEEYRERTVKNALEHGAGRGTYFLAKWVSSVLLGLLLAAAVFGAYFGSAALLLGGGAGAELAKDAFSRIGAACAVYIAAATVSLFLLTVFSRSAAAIFAYYGAFYLSGLLLQLFKQKWALPALLRTQLTNAVSEPAPDYAAVLAVAAVTLAVFFAAGLAATRRKDLA